MLQSKANQLTRENHDNATLVNLYRNGLKVRVALDPEHYQLLSEAYSPMIIIPGNQQPPSGSHQLAAAHQSIAAVALAKFVENLDSFIEIGPNAASFARIAIGKYNPHACTLRSARDQGRHLSSAMSNEVRGYRPTATQTLAIQAGGLSHRQVYEDIQCLASGIPTETFCLNGWQNCDARAQVAISNHSLYDISFRDLAVGMRNHGTHRIKAFIHFPTEAMDVNEWTSYEKGYHFKHDTKTGKIVFGWNGDTAFSYQHDYKTWMSYLTTGGFSTPFGFNVIIEKVAFHGSQFELNIYRATAAGDFCFTIPNALSDLIKVPNFRVLAANNFCKRNFNPKDPSNYIITDGSKVRKLLDFINARADKGFSLEVVKAYARTLVSEIRLGARTVEQRWHCTSSEFSDICVSVYILSAYQRRLDTHIINAAFSHMDQIGAERSLFGELYGWICHTFGILHHHSPDKKAAQTTSNLFHRCALSFFEDYHRHDSFKECGYNEEVFFDYNIETFPDIEPTKNEILAAQANLPKSEDPQGRVTPEWALMFNLPVNVDPELEPVYMAEEQHKTLIQECLQGSEQAEAKALKAVLKSAHDELISRHPKRLHLENMFALTGVPGGAKTSTIIDRIIPTVIPTGPVLVLCPTRALADKYEKQLHAPSAAATIHAGLRQLKKQKWALVIVEEAFTLPIAYINFIAEEHKTLLVGDPRQIQHVDFSGLWSRTMMLETLLPAIPRHHINCTRRCPQDVVALPIIRSAYPGISSASKCSSSIVHVNAKFTNDKAVNVCFTQLAKSQIEAFSGRNACTVHECQGQTFESVILHYSGTRAEEELIRKSPNHLIVGLTRHTTNLFIRDTSENGDITTFINDKTPLNMIADSSRIDLQAVDAAPLPKAATFEQAVPPTTPYAFCKSEVGTASLVLDRYYPAVPPREEIAVSSTHLEPGGDAKGVIRLAALGDEELFESKPHTVYRFKAPQRVMVTRGHQSHMLLRTNLERLTHSTKNLQDTVCKPLADRLFSQVEDHFNWELPENAHHQCFLEAIQRMQERGHDITKLKEIDKWTDQSANLVKSFLKAQQKPMLGKDPLEADKAGQGISAWDKTLNLIMAPWTRLLEQVLVNQSKGTVRILSQMSDSQVMAILEQDTVEGEKYIDNDWTKFDSNQNNLTREILRRALLRIGAPPILVSYFIEQLKTRRICAAQSSLVVNDKKDSGAPHTLVDNCLFNLAICLDVMQDFDKLYIKGDDSLARGPDVSFNLPRLNHYNKTCGFQFKPNTSSVGQFVSFLVSPRGVALDLARIAAKVTSRAYTNKEDYDNYALALAGTLKPIDVDAGNNMCVVNSLFHHSNSRMTSDFDVLLSFLFRFSRREIPFSELTKHEAIYYKTPGNNKLQHTQGKHNPSVRKNISRGLSNIVASFI
ncbi:non-structural polyprotein [Bastrovirus-like_virus/VietNam/Bat/17819_21]|uniref:non-structural polyprotein n=1 Tax=Bastrovirus-like_virus/VietNam/Bat/17819_21 TaxID=1906170 RepID=UPI0009476026|nr:non-structural polyprotein [Bastrovirus-like_virus/VietNam/Bat/17819_21]APQ43043.1 non-structural polyprotein [Bastrovirus-like_virus/VietNam/Bat/17819_21]